MRQQRCPILQLLLPGLIASAGCGDNELPCYGLGAPYYCEVPRELALRTTQALTPSDDEVRGYFRLLRPIYAQMPILALVKADYHYSYLQGTFGFATGYPQLIESWRDGDWASSDPVRNPILFDAPASLTVTEMPSASLPPGHTFFHVEAWGYERMSWRVLEARIANIPDTTPEGEFMDDPGMDITHLVNGTDDQFFFELGWGDCQNGCVFVHRWLATVHADDTVAIEDRGGASLDVDPFWYEMAAALPPLPDI
jgi:hypothetical protein